MTNHTTCMLSTPLPGPPGKQVQRGDRQLGLSLVLGFQNGILSLPLETRKLKPNAHWGFRVGASETLWEGMRVPGSCSWFSSLSYHGTLTLQHAVRKARSRAHKEAQLAWTLRSSKQMHVLAGHCPPGPPVPGLGQAAHQGRADTCPLPTVQGAQGGPAHGAAVLEALGTALRGWAGGPHLLSPICATPLPVLLNRTQTSVSGFL